MNVFKRFLASVTAAVLFCGFAGCSENEVGGSRGDTESGQFSDNSQPLESGQTSVSDTTSGVSNKTENVYHI